MLITSKSDHDPMVHGVKSKIRKKNAGKSSSCPEYAQASVQIPREDQPMILGPDQTIGGIYRLFRKCSGGADGGVLGVNGSIRPSCLDKVLCALQVNGRVFIERKLPLSSKGQSALTGTNFQQTKRTNLF